MKKIGLILSGVFLVVAMCFGLTVSVVASDGSECTCEDGITKSTVKNGECQCSCVKTAILGEGGIVCDNKSGSGVTYILETVVKILSVGVGILGVLGITIVGIQYLTAGGSEEKTRKAKRRMLEIIIGLVAYVLIYALLKWLKVA